MTARQAAYLSLLKSESDGKYSNLELSASIEKYSLSGVEKSFYTALFYGVTERRLTLDYILSLFSDRKPEEIDRDVKTAIHIGLYQIFFMDKVPESAAVNESVALLRRFYAKKNSEGFANAVLRSAIRGKDKIRYPDRRKETVKYLSVYYSVSEWLSGELVSIYGAEKAEVILASSNSHPSSALSVNTLKITRDALILKLRENGIVCTEAGYSPVGIKIEESVAYEKLSLFDSLFFVQDEASQLCAAVLGAKPGECILDACASPGGKSFRSAIDMENKGRVLSCDLHKNKLSLIESGAKRLGISIIETKEQNGSVFEPSLGLFDRVLCDVPCSGFGVIAKKPEIRYKSKEDVSRLPLLQSAILDNCSRYVKDGGTLVYSTCTILPEENEKITDAFLSSHPEFSYVPFTAAGKKTDGKLTLLPGASGTDGFYISKFIKRI